MYLGNSDNPYLVLVKAESTSITSCTINENTKVIYSYAFYNCSELESITIPNSVTNIGGSAFYGCSSLQYNKYDNALYLGNSDNPYLVLVKEESTSITSCTINENVKFIYSYAFDCCRRLESITIPNSVTSVDYSAFYNCSSLTSITVAEGNTNYASQDGILYNKDKTILISVPHGITGAVTIPDGVTSIGEEAFSSCRSLTSVTIPNSVTSIGDHAFYYCSELESITIPDSVTSIGFSAFSSCGSLQYNEYDNAYYLGNDTNKYVVLIDAKDTSITSCTINENTKVIYISAFSSCSSLTSITIPNSVTSIDYSAFYDCSSLTSITVAEGNTNYASQDGILYNKDKTILISVPSGITGAVTIPNGVTSIDDSKFFCCYALTSITIPDSVTSIGSYVLYYCQNLSTINFTGTVAQWNAITKGTNWHYYISATKVICSDGEVTL